MALIKTTAYRSKALMSDLILGVTDGLDSALWCYAFAAVIYTGTLSVFLPVGVLTMLVGWALLSIFITLTTSVPLHQVNIDEQSVVIIASIGVLISAEIGAEAASPRGLATLLFIVAISSLLVSVCCFLVGHYRLSRLLELLPYPVICGFMAGIGWLLLDAGVVVATDLSLSPGLLEGLSEDGRSLRLALTVLCGAGVMWFANRVGATWSLPAASMAIVLVFYAFVFFSGKSHSELVASGWLMEVVDNEGGALGIIRTLSPSDVDLAFVAEMIPQILTIVFLVLLSVSMSLSALNAESDHDLHTRDEFKNLSGGNLLSAMVCSPPGYTDVVASSLYKEFGASSRWMPLTSSFVCILIAVFGGWIIGYVPVLLVGATIFFFTFQTFYEWMYENVHQFSRMDYVIILIILGTVIFAGFTEGILVGIVLTALLFVIRYSLISSIQSRHSLRDHRSSVERSSSSNTVLEFHGSEVLVYTLRGYLFFGTANAVLETIRDEPKILSGQCRAILLDMKRVTGMDISALNTFELIENKCSKEGVILLYSGLSPPLARAVSEMKAASKFGGRALVFPDSDYALEYLEELLLEHEPSRFGTRSIGDLLFEIVEDEEKVTILLESMSPVECKSGQTLFSQGDPDDGLYIVESGSLSAMIETRSGAHRRVRKFNPGSLIGELSAYMPDGKRTATIVADENAVLYHLDTGRLKRQDGKNLKLAVCIHEMIAKTLAERMGHMNRRLMVELD
jgi:SulP family sulfate permease